MIPEPRRAAPATGVAIFLLGMCALISLYSTQPVLTQIGRWAHVPAADAGWTVSATTLGVACTAPIAGALSDRIGRRRVILVAVLALAAMSALCAIAPTFVALLSCRFVQGLCTPFVFAVAVAYIGDEFRPADAVRLNGVYVAGTAFGGFAGRLLPGLAADLAEDWRASFLPLLALLVGAAAATLAWLPEERRFIPSQSIAAGLRSVASHLRAPEVLVTCVVGAGLLFQQVSSFTLASLHLQEPPLGLGPVQVGLVFAVFLVPVATTQLAARVSARAGRVRVFIASGVTGVLGLALMLIPAVPAVVVGLACSCIAVFAGQAAATGYLTERIGRHRSAAIGLYLTAYYLGGSLGGVALAPLFGDAGWVAVVLVMIAVAAGTTSAGALAWRRRMGGGR